MNVCMQAESIKYKQKHYLLTDGAESNLRGSKEQRLHPGALVVINKMAWQLSLKSV